MSNPEPRRGRLARLRRRVPAAGWAAVVLIGAAIAVPASAVAASNLVGISGSNGARAAVTSASALQTAEASPTSLVSIYGYTSGGCTKIYTIPAHEALIIQSVTFNNVTVPTTGDDHFTGLYDLSTCADYFLDQNPGGTGEVSVPLPTGVALKSGTSIYQYTSTGQETELWVNGYLVPASAVPTNHVSTGARHSGL
jgi:uncharacterized membrane protein